MDAADGGAAELLLSRSDRPSREVLLVRRPDHHNNETWGLPSSALRLSETPVQAALRAAVELSVDTSGVRVEAVWVDDRGGRPCATVVATADDELKAGPSGSERMDIRWVRSDDLADVASDPDSVARWPKLVKVGPAPVLIVDGANVVGSRPDGWWRDRAGAASRLRDQLAAAWARGLELAALQPTGPAGPMGLTCFPEIILVTEGAARRVASVPGVEVVPAPGSGDDQIVRLAAELSPGPRPVAAVTADRELRRRLAAYDVPALGPGTLLRLITPDPV